MLAGDDLARIRQKEQSVPRDNVVFELGLFVGGLGMERTFLVVPRGAEELRLPTDLAGITPATFDPERQDGNLTAALGPAASRVRKAMTRIGLIARRENSLETARAPLDENDCISLLESWMGQRSSSENQRAIKFDDVDRELGLPAGSAEKHLEQAARRWDYRVARRGANTIVFTDK